MMAVEWISANLLARSYAYATRVTSSQHPGRGRFLGSSALVPLDFLSLVRHLAGLQVKQISARVAQIPLELSPVESRNVVGRVEEALCPIRASPISCRLYPICTNRLCPSFGGSFLRQILRFECERS